MKSAPSQITNIVVRLALAMLVFGLLSQSAQACLRSARFLAEAAPEAPCQLMLDKQVAGHHPGCAAHRLHADA